MAWLQGSNGPGVGNHAKGPRAKGQGRGQGARGPRAKGPGHELRVKDPRANADIQGSKRAKRGHGPGQGLQGA